MERGDGRGLGGQGDVGHRTFLSFYRVRDPCQSTQTTSVREEMMLISPSCQQERR